MVDVHTCDKLCLLCKYRDEDDDDDGWNKGARIAINREHYTLTANTHEPILLYQDILHGRRHNSKRREGSTNPVE